MISTNSLALAAQAENPDEPTPFADRPPVLVVAHRVPYPPDKGDRIRTFHLLRTLSRWATIDLACLADEPPDPDAVDALSAVCRRVAVVPLGPSRWLRAAWSLSRGRTVTEGAFASSDLKSTLQVWSRQTPYRAALVSASGLAPYLRLEALREMPAVVDLVDLDSQKWLDYATASQGARRWLYRTEGNRLRRLERSLPDWVRAITLVSASEADLYRRCCGDGPVHAVTNGVDLDFFRPGPPSEGASCVFVGALDYRPNVDGACWFVREVWPEVLRRRPEARLALVGRRPVPAIQRLESVPGVDVVGQVPDVRPHLAESSVAIAPLRIARGVQNKVLEAMAAGRVVVASPEALDGLGAVAGTHLLSASDPSSWVDAIGRILGDTDLRTRLEMSGRRYVEERHRWETCLEPFAELLGLEVFSEAEANRRG